MSNIPPQSLNEIVNVLNPQQQHIFSAFMNNNTNNNNNNRSMQMGINPGVVGNNSMPNNMNNNNNNMANNQLFNTFRALQQQQQHQQQQQPIINQQNSLMNGPQPTLNNGQTMNTMNMNMQQNNGQNIPMQNNNDSNNYLLHFLQQQLTPNNLRNAGKQVMPTNQMMNQSIHNNNSNGMIGNESQMMGGFSNGMNGMDNTMMSNINNMANLTNMTNMANMGGMTNVNTMNTNNNMNTSNIGNMGNPTTPLSQMTGAVPNNSTVNNSNNNMSHQRSGTPLSNNSGGVLSSNTNTTTNTQSGISANGMRRFSVEQIKLVQQLIEQCLKLYLSKDETMDFLCKKYENIERAFINLMWCKLEQQNPEFFKAYNTRLSIKDQISQFNQLVKEQAGLMQQQGLLVQSNNAPQMPSTPTNGMINLQQQQPTMVGMQNMGIMSGNIQSPYNSASSPVTNQNTFGMIPNQQNVGTMQVNNGGAGMNANNGGAGGAFIGYPGVNGPGNFGINLQNAGGVLGMNNFQQGGGPNNGMVNPQNMSNPSAAVLNFAQQQQNLYRQQQQQQQPTNPQQPNFNNNNNLSPQKQPQMNVNLGLGTSTNETINHDPNSSNIANMFNPNTVNGTAGADISQMITHLLSSPTSVSTTTPQAKQTIQNFLKSPLVKVDRDVEEKLRSLLNEGEPQNTQPINSNTTTATTQDLNRQISNGTPITNNSTTGTSTPTIDITTNPISSNVANNTQQQTETPTIENVFEFPDDKVDVFGVNDFDDDFFHNHDE